MSDNLTVKQQKWLDVYVKTGNATRAAFEAYDCNGSYRTAANIGHENVKKLEVPIKTLMEAQGLGLDVLLQKAREGLNADRTISATIIAGDQKDANSMTKDFIDVPDYAVRHKYLETLGRWFGLIDKRDPTVNQTNQQLNIIVNDGQLAERMARIFGGSNQGSDLNQT